MEISRGFHSILKNLSFILWAMGSHGRYLSRDKSHHSGFPNITLLPSVESVGEGRTAGEDVNNDTAAAWAGANACLEEDREKTEQTAGSLAGGRVHRRGGGGSREKPGVAARSQHQIYLEGWGPHQLLALDPGVVLTHSLPASGLSSQKTSSLP